MILHFSGHLAKPCEVRTTQAGKTVTSFEVGADLGFGENKKTLWVKCSLWGDRGPKIQQFLTKGQKVTVHGRMHEIEAFLKRDGQPGAAIKVDVIDVELHGGKRDAGQDAPTPGPDLDDEIPF